MLATEGFDPVYGARPLKRVIQRRIENELAMRLLQGEFSEGATVRVDTAPTGELIFTPWSRATRRLPERETAALMQG